MHRLAIALALIAAACGPKGSGGTGPSNGGDGTDDPTRTKQVIVTWGVEAVGGADADPPHTKVWLSVTDENGAAKSYPVGEIDAACGAEEGGDMSAIGLLRCWYAGGGANFIVVVRGQELIVLRQWTDEGMDEPADYEEQTRVTFPAGAKVTFQL